jgi:hypothetical protein
MHMDMTGKSVGEVEQTMKALTDAGFTCSVSGSIDRTVIYLK